MWPKEKKIIEYVVLVAVAFLLNDTGLMSWICNKYTTQDAFVFIAPTCGKINN